MISKETYLRIQELSKLGVSNRKIAPQVGVSHSQVGKYVKMSEGGQSQVHRNTVHPYPCLVQTCTGASDF